MSHVIAIVNQKGGVGKTTTAINLGASLAVAEKRTLVVDIDPQGNATSGLGVEGRESLSTVYDVLMGDRSADESILYAVHFPCLDVIPSTRDLVGAEIELVQARRRETILRRALEPIREQYDYVLVDCPPSLGLLTLNTLTAADSVLIPIQCEFYALEGLSQLLDTIHQVRMVLNARLQVAGVLLTMSDTRTNLSNQVAEDVRQHFPRRTFQTLIPRSVRLGEAPSHGQTVLSYAPESAGAKAYEALAAEFMDRFPVAIEAAESGERPGENEHAPSGSRVSQK